MFSIQQERGTGTRRWKVLYRDYVVAKGLRKGEARRCLQILEPMDEVVRQIVARELEDASRAIRSQSERWVARGTSKRAA